MPEKIPLSLYIHIPWCIKKCPYCDFNSYTATGELLEEQYIAALFEDLKSDLVYVQDRKIESIFFGGGTPSLFTPQGIEKILDNTASVLKFSSNIEITLEANPGTMEHKDFKDYRLAGVNRISLGVQSFQDQKLKALGRIHSAKESFAALESLLKSNFKSFNIDLMYGLPEQSLEDALFDLRTALNFEPFHLSWYNLNIEPNTLFHQRPPVLPDDDSLWNMSVEGEKILNTAGLHRYEVSAFSKTGFESVHNLNYWRFGDYLGIGAGAHSKLTDLNQKKIYRLWKTRYPKNYLDPKSAILSGKKLIAQNELPFEFMMNGLRLKNGVEIDLYENRTFQTSTLMLKKLKIAKEKGLLQDYEKKGIFCATSLGYRFLNDLVQLFLD